MASPVKNPKKEDDDQMQVEVENDNYGNESAVDEIDENDTDSLNDTTEVANDDGMRFTMTQDNFIEDSPLAMARVI